MKQRTNYDANFKAETVKLAKETSVSKASQDLGVPENTIRNWVKLSAKRGDNPFIGSGRKYISPEDAKVAALEKENCELKRANEILKEALGFFAASCSTGIRVSELRFITVEAVRTGQAEIKNKGKTRIVFIPGGLRKLLMKYTKTHGISAGSIFITKTGKPLNRSAVWSEMKKLCETAGVKAEKVFPHNLRRLFAVTFYRKWRDIAKLAEILGHSDVNTTRIYVMQTSGEYRRVIDNLGLVRLTT